jgi:hypothetical protein
VKHDLAAFAALHDKNAIVTAKIEAALKKVGPKSWRYEGDFVKLAGLALCQWVKQREKYAHLTLLAKGVGRGVPGKGKRVVAGSKAFADQLRALVQ